MTDESDAQLTVSGEARFVSLPRPRSNRRMAHQTSELGDALAESRIAKRLLDHPATGPGLKRIVMASMLILNTAKSRVVNPMPRFSQVAQFKF